MPLYAVLLAASARVLGTSTRRLYQYLVRNLLSTAVPIQETKSTNDTAEHGTYHSH